MDSYPLPCIQDCIYQVGHSKYVSKFDMLKGNWQVPLSKRAKEISAYIDDVISYSDDWSGHVEKINVF